MWKFRRRRDILVIAILFWIMPGSKAQEDSSCYGPGSIAASVIITILVTLFLLYVLYVIWKRYWRNRKGKHLVLETDPEKGKNAYAFDNAGFTDPSSASLDKTNKSKWTSWSPLGALMMKNEKQRTLDDSALQVQEIKTVSLKSHDFTGLGFNIYGNMRDGIYIKDILHRGPASESGKLNLGDRIKSVTINFEHVVYEDALTILSYASPYEVILEAQSGKMVTNQTPTKTVQLGHPLYRSVSTTDLIQIQKSSKKRLFPTDDINTSTMSSPYSSLQKTCSTATTLERNQSASPKPEYQNIIKTTKAPASSPQQLKTQLEQKIFQNHKQQLRAKDEKPRQENVVESQKTENKYQKFGIRVLPVELKSEQSSPKSTELSQNDNNINLERHSGKFGSPITEDIGKIEISFDEVDKLEKKDVAPPVKKREKSNKSNEDLTQTPPKENENPNTEAFVRQNSTSGSGIKRDKNGIPQEIPSHMFNAAVAARKNRRPSEDTSEDIKSPKKPKGRAPAPPDDKNKNFIPESPTSPVPLNTEPKINLDEIHIEETQQQPIQPPSFEEKITKDMPDYVSDSDMETDNQSSVNTIELNASDITIHQTEDTEEIQNRRTASTGDLTKIQKTRKTSTGTLERAQSLDITDTTIPTLSKKRKGGSIEGSFDSKSGSDDSLYGKALVHKEPRLSLALDGLNTFQRSRLKKSTEWGNMEDAILNLDTDEADSFHQQDSPDKSVHVDALVNKINEIKQESDTVQGPKIVSQSIMFEPSPVKNEEFSIKSPFNYSQEKINSNTITNGNTEINQPEIKKIEDITWPTFEHQNGSPENEIKFTHSTYEPKPTILESNTSVFITPDVSEYVTSNIQNTLITEKPVKPAKPISLLPSPAVASENFLLTEKCASNDDPFYSFPTKIYDTNVSDDIKVSRHSLGSLEKSDDFKPLNSPVNSISNVTISNNDPHQNNEFSSLEININDSNSSIKHLSHQEPQENDELYTTALDTTLRNETLKNSLNDSSIEYEKVSVTSSTTLIKDLPSLDTSDTVTIEGPTSLTLEINDDSPKISKESPLEISTKKPQISNKSFNISPVTSTVSVHQDHSPKSNYSLTYITEIQVLTPNNDTQEVKTTPEPEHSENLNDKSDKFESYLQNFESNIKNFESRIQTASETQNNSVNETIDPEKELHKIQEIAEEQLKKLPEMRFSTSSYESPKVSENSTSQIEQLRSNFEKPPPKSPPKSETGSLTKSRIPVATTKTPPTSPERRDSRNFDLEIDKEIVAIMASPIHSTPIPMNLKYQPKSVKNVSVTSIRSNSKIPSGFPGSRPPVPPRRYDTSDGESTHRVSTNGSANSSFKQWVFNPDENTVTNITVTENKMDNK